MQLLDMTSALARRVCFWRNRRPKEIDPGPAVGRPSRRGHRAGAGRWCGVFSGGKGNGRQGRASPSNTWTRAPEQTVIAHDADYQITAADRATIRAGKALFFSGKALAKADLICAKQEGLEILWYWVARRSSPWVVEDVLLPDHQQATAGTCYASPEMVLAVSRCARRVGWVILGAGHSHGHLGVFSSSVDLELMSQLAAERVGFASQAEQAVRGIVAKQGEEPVADDPDEPPKPVSVFEITFDDNPDVWVTVTARADLPDGALDAKLHLVHRHQASFFTTHNAEGDRYFPVHHVTACLHCGTRLEDHTSEEVEIHVIGPQTLSEDEETDLIADLEEKAPRGRFFRERWGWGQAEMHPTIEPAEPADPQKQTEAEQLEAPADFFVYRRGRREGKVPAAVLEEAACRCPALARALGWKELGDDVSQDVPGDRAEPHPGDTP